MKLRLIRSLIIIFMLWRVSPLSEFNQHLQNIFTLLVNAYWFTFWSCSSSSYWNLFCYWLTPFKKNNIFHISYDIISYCFHAIDFKLNSLKSSSDCKWNGPLECYRRNDLCSKIKLKFKKNWNYDISTVLIVRMLGGVFPFIRIQTTSSSFQKIIKIK